MIEVLNWLSEHICCGSGLLLAVLMIVGGCFTTVRVIFRGYDPPTKDES